MPVLNHRKRISKPFEMSSLKERLILSRVTINCHSDLLAVTFQRSPESLPAAIRNLLRCSRGFVTHPYHLRCLKSSRDIKRLQGDKSKMV